MRLDLQHLLGNLGTRIEQNTANFKKHQDETIAQGRIPDHRKMELLKAEMFRRVMIGQPTQAVLDAIDILLEIQKQEDTYRNSLSGQIDSLFTLVLCLGITVIPLSFVSTWTCGSSRSPLCQKVRVIPNAILHEFQEPRPNPVSGKFN
ncbi:MAG: hypothetical protein KME46_21960 [Brasilonema angustatum HA4187-MV1]|jgi:hypothetical protein|nr:hypothetical protein [Brasilonema angustatum HA4187-MV1]